MMKGDGGSKARTQSTGSGMSVVLKKERDSLDRFLRLCDLQNLLQHEVNYIYPTLSLYRG